MAKVVDNYKKFKVLEITRQEMMDKLTRYGCLGICDMCNRPTSVGLLRGGNQSMDVQGLL